MDVDPSVFCFAIHDSQQPSSPIGLLCSKLPPPPCAVLLAKLGRIFAFLPHILKRGGWPGFGSPRVRSKASQILMFFSRSLANLAKSVQNTGICAGLSDMVKHGVFAGAQTCGRCAETFVFAVFWEVRVEEVSQIRILTRWQIRGPVCIDVRKWEKRVLPFQNLIGQHLWHAPMPFEHFKLSKFSKHRRNPPT